MPTNPRMMPVSHMPFAAGSFFLADEAEHDRGDREEQAEVEPRRDEADDAADEREDAEDRAWCGRRGRIGGSDVPGLRGRSGLRRAVGRSCRSGGRGRRHGRDGGAGLLGKVRIGHGSVPLDAVVVAVTTMAGRARCRSIRGIRYLAFTLSRCVRHAQIRNGFVISRHERRIPSMNDPIGVDQTWISVTGSVESAPKSRSDGRMPRHHELRAERRDHRAVVGAERQRRHAKRDARGIGALLGDLRGAGRSRRRRRPAGVAARRGRRTRRWPSRPARRRPPRGNSPRRRRAESAARPPRAAPPTARRRSSAPRS